MKAAMGRTTARTVMKGERGRERCAVWKWTTLFVGSRGLCVSDGGFGLCVAMDGWMDQSIDENLGEEEGEATYTATAKSTTLA